MWNFLARSLRWLAKKVHIVARGWYLTISKCRKPDNTYNASFSTIWYILTASFYWCREIERWPIFGMETGYRSRLSNWSQVPSCRAILCHDISVAWVRVPAKEEQNIWLRKFTHCWAVIEMNYIYIVWLLSSVLNTTTMLDFSLHKIAS